MMLVCLLMWLLLSELCLFNGTLANTVDCSAFASKGECDSKGYQTRCRWISSDESTVVRAGGECENTEDYVYQPSLLPFLRVTKEAFEAVKPPTSGAECIGSLINDIAHEPCYAVSSVPLDRCACNGQLDFTYQIPRGRNLKLSSKLLLNHTMFIFIHINKAAGETFKNIAYRALEVNRWDGAGYGTRNGWQYLDRRRPIYTFPTWQRHSSHSNKLKNQQLDDSNRGKVMYTSCGERFSTFEHVNDYVLNHEGMLEKEREDCPLRFIWGNAAVGLCDHFPNQPCVYLLVLRDPLSRALSDYTYFCVDGAEGRKKWTNEMLAKGECTMSPLQWFSSMRTSPYFLQERLTRSCDATCGVEVALQNLFHPCVRYILVENFADGLRRLKEALAPAFTDAIDQYLSSPKRINRRGHGQSRFKLKVKQYGNSTLTKLREFLRDDYIIYDEAVRRYEEQWTRPITSCNEFRLP